MFRRKFFLLAAISFSLGLLISHYFSFLKLIPAYFYFFLSFLLFLFLLKFKKIFWLILFFLTLSFWRYSLVFLNKTSNASNYLDQLFKLRGVVLAEPEIKNDKQKIKVQIKQGEDQTGNLFKLEGRILIYAPISPQYNFTDCLIIEGEYLLPSKIENFAYDLFLKKSGIEILSYYPKIEKLDNNSLKKSKNLLYKFKSFTYRLREKISEIFDRNLNLRSSAVLKAMLIGDKTSISSEDLENFSRSGLSHIIAISGLHVTLLTSLFLNLLLFLGLSRKRSFYFSIVFLLFYLFLIGFPPSACRASLMGFLSFLAIYMGRSGNIVNALFFTALVLLLINPLFLFIDLGFQLSFLAVLGIIYIYPALKELFLLKLHFLNKVPESLVDTLTLTTAVQIIAAPILLSSFSQVSLLAPLSNLLVLWILPLLISLAIISLLLVPVFLFLAQFVYFFIDLILSYILLVSELVNKIPLSFVEFSGWPLWLSLAYYSFLFYLFIFRNKKRAKN